MTDEPRFAHRFTTRVYYADTDFSGVVYYGRYLEFLERGRSDLLREAGITHRDLIAGRTNSDEGASSHDDGNASPGMHGPPLAWVVRRIEIDYRGSARIEDEITVHTGIGEVRGARLRMHQRITLGERTILDASVDAALITLEGRPRRLPATWLDRFEALRSR